VEKGSGRSQAEGGRTWFQNGRRNGDRPGGAWFASVLKSGHGKVKDMEHESAIHDTDPSTEPCHQTLIDPVGNPPTPRRPTHDREMTGCS